MFFRPVNWNTFENIPNLAKWSKKIVSAFIIKSWIIHIASNCPSSSSYWKKKQIVQNVKTKYVNNSRKYLKFIYRHWNNYIIKLFFYYYRNAQLNVLLVPNNNKICHILKLEKLQSKFLQNWLLKIADNKKYRDKSARTKIQKMIICVVSIINYNQ